MKFRLFLIVLGCLFGLSATAEPLKFKSWKEQQILEAQNEVLRISARLHQQKTNPENEKSTAKDSDLLGLGRLEQAPEVTERDLRYAQEGLTIAHELSLEDYADVYVANLKEDSPDQFNQLMDSLSREELTQLMKILMKNKDSKSSNAVHNPPLGGASLTVSASH